MATTNPGPPSTTFSSPGTVNPVYAAVWIVDIVCQWRGGNLNDVLYWLVTNSEDTYAVIFQMCLWDHSNEPHKIGEPTTLLQLDPSFFPSAVFSFGLFLTFQSMMQYSLSIRLNSDRHKTYPLEVQSSQGLNP